MSTEVSSYVAVMEQALEAFEKISRIKWKDNLGHLEKPTDFESWSAALFALSEARARAALSIIPLRKAINELQQKKTYEQFETENMMLRVRNERFERELEEAKEFTCSTDICRWLKPLTDDKVRNVYREVFNNPTAPRIYGLAERFARAIEDAHGIK